MPFGRDPEGRLLWVFRCLTGALMNRYEWFINEKMGNAVFNDAYVLPQNDEFFGGNRRVV